MSSLVWNVEQDREIRLHWLFFFLDEAAKEMNEKELGSKASLREEEERKREKVIIYSQIIKC